MRAVTYNAFIVPRKKLNLVYLPHESAFGNRTYIARRSEESARRFSERARQMGGHHAARAQRMDLLDDIGQDAGDAEGSCAEGGLGTYRRNAPALLLDLLHPSDCQVGEQIGAMGARQTSQVQIGSRLLFRFLVHRPGAALL